MQNSRQEVDIELLTTHYKSISFKATLLELWDRSVQGKTIGIRIQSMLPQINLTGRLLEVLSSISRERRVGVCTAFKYSPTHYLSLCTSEFQWFDHTNLPRADYLIYLKPTALNRIIDHMSHEEKLLESFMQSLEKIVSRQQKIEVLDLCRSLIMFTKDKVSQKLLLRCEILFPYINLLFSPVVPIKFVSSSLIKKLIQIEDCEFKNGFLTMDQNSRVVPLDFEDKMVCKYPIIGIWVKGVPQTNASCKGVNLVHPLVWAACVQFILFNGFKEKVSPCLQTCAFLFVDFSNRPKFYEVSSQKQPTWRTTFFAKEIPLGSSETFRSLQISFLKQDHRFTLKQAVSDGLSYISQSTCNSRSCTPPSSKPPIHRMNPTYSSSKDLLRPKSYENIIIEQTKLIEKLQAQVYKLQTQVISPKSKSYVASPTDSDSFKVSTQTNTSFTSFPNNKLIASKKIMFDTDEVNDEKAYEKKKVYVFSKLHHGNHG